MLWTSFLWQNVFLSRFADILKPFLTAYQNYKTMVYHFYSICLKRMLCFKFVVVKPNFVYKKGSLLKLKLFEIDLNKVDNLPSAENMNIGFVASAY